MTSSFRTFQPWIAGTFFVLTLYVLSIGPAFKYIPEATFTRWGYFDAEGAYNRIYRPINKACAASDTLDAVVARYLGWWIGERVSTGRERKKFNEGSETHIPDEHYGVGP